MSTDYRARAEAAENELRAIAAKVHRPRPWWQQALELLSWFIVLPLAGLALWSVAGSYGWVAPPPVVPPMPTAEVIGTPRPAQDARQAAPAAPGRAQEAAPVSQPAEVATAAPIERVPVEGKVDAAPAVLAAPEPPKATPAGKAEPTPEPKVRGGKGTP